MTILKIAVLLRGQLRAAEEGAHLFKKFVIDKFPQHEFRFFISAPLRISNFISPVPEYSCKNLLHSEAEEKINFWPLVQQFSFQSESELFNTVKKIVVELLHDHQLIDWVASYNKKYNNKKGQFDFTTLAVTDCDSDNIIMKSYIIELHNLLSQYYSFACAFKVLKDYTSTTEYIPDLVWSTRTDVFHIFNAIDHFDILLNQLNNLYNDKISNKKAIISNVVLIDNNHPFVCDFNFFSTYKMLDTILNLDNQTCHDIIYNAMIKNKAHIVKLSTAGNTLQHTMWSAIFNNVCFCQTELKHVSSIIRHSFSSIDILKMTGTKEDASLIMKMRSDYKHIIQKLVMNDNMICDEFDYLSKN